MQRLLHASMDPAGTTSDARGVPTKPDDADWSPLDPVDIDWQPIEYRPTEFYFGDDATQDGQAAPTSSGAPSGSSTAPKLSSTYETNPIPLVSTTQATKQKPLATSAATKAPSEAPHGPLSADLATHSTAVQTSPRSSAVIQTTPNARLAAPSHATSSSAASHTTAAEAPSRSLALANQETAPKAARSHVSAGAAAGITVGVAAALLALGASWLLLLHRRRRRHRHGHREVVDHGNGAAPRPTTSRHAGTQTSPSHLAADSDGGEAKGEKEEEEGECTCHPYVVTLGGWRTARDARREREAVLSLDAASVLDQAAAYDVEGQYVTANTLGRLFVANGTEDDGDVGVAPGHPYRRRVDEERYLAYHPVHSRAGQHLNGRVHPGSLKRPWVGEEQPPRPPPRSVQLAWTGALRRASESAPTYRARESFLDLGEEPTTRPVDGSRTRDGTVAMQCATSTRRAPTVSLASAWEAAATGPSTTDALDMWHRDTEMASGGGPSRQASLEPMPRPAASKAKLLTLGVERARGATVTCRGERRADGEVGTAVYDAEHLLHARRGASNSPGEVGTALQCRTRRAESVQEAGATAAGRIQWPGAVWDDDVFGARQAYEATPRDACGHGEGEEAGKQTWRSLEASLQQYGGLAGGSSSASTSRDEDHWRRERPETPPPPTPPPDKDGRGLASRSAAARDIYPGGLKSTTARPPPLLVETDREDAARRAALEEGHRTIRKEIDDAHEAGECCSERFRGSPPRPAVNRFSMGASALKGVSPRSQASHSAHSAGASSPSDQDHEVLRSGSSAECEDRRTSAPRRLELRPLTTAETWSGLETKEDAELQRAFHLLDVVRPRRLPPTRAPRRSTAGPTDPMDSPSHPRGRPYDATIDASSVTLGACSVVVERHHRRCSPESHGETEAYDGRAAPSSLSPSSSSSTHSRSSSLLSSLRSAHAWLEAEEARLARQ